MKVDMIVVPQSYWAHLEVLWLNTYVPAKTLAAMKISRLFSGGPSLRLQCTRNRFGLYETSLSRKGVSRGLRRLRTWQFNGTGLGLRGRSGSWPAA